MLSIITPLHAPGNAYILETYQSLAAQSHRTFEWVILENHGGVVPPEVRQDSRVRVMQDSSLEGVGALKKHLTALARGEIVVELDADDLLAPNALEAIACAFAETKTVDFVYSDFAEFLDGSWDPNTYSASFGWETYVTRYGDHKLLAMRAPPATAQNLRFVDWAPNHVRAWRKTAYDRVGGHNAQLLVADDHDLIVRMYLAGLQFRHIPECLYFYRVHAHNTVATRNPEIRAGTTGVYNRCIWALAEKWARDQNLLLIDLCGGLDAPPGYRPVDRELPAGVGGDRANLDGPWPYKDSSVGLIRAHDAVEHLRDPVHTMNEAWRCLAPGGFLLIDVPSTNGQGAFCDPTHASFWNQLSFRYYTSQAFARYVPAFKGRFQSMRVIEWFPDDWHKANNIPYVEAHLIALKPGYQPMGEVLWDRATEAALIPIHAGNRTKKKRP